MCTLGFLFSLDEGGKQEGEETRINGNIPKVQISCVVLKRRVASVTPGLPNPSDMLCLFLLMRKHTIEFGLIYFIWVCSLKLKYLSPLPEFHSLLVKLLVGKP